MNFIFYNIKLLLFNIADFFFFSQFDKNSVPDTNVTNSLSVLESDSSAASSLQR